MIETLDDEFEFEPERERPRKPRHKVDRAELVEEGGDDAQLKMTYEPSRFERGWLHSSLNGFYHQNLITDVLASVKGGKEASVYRCAAHPGVGVPLLAAKVYRPRQFRNLRNDALYREGRAILKDDGSTAKRTDHRLMRAIGKKTDFGVQAQHTSWLMHEFTTLERLHTAGAAVPRPIAAGENAILMGYEGDHTNAAPTLIEIGLEREEAEALLAEALRNIELMLQHHLIHGDLSAYNILYWEGRITLIDFPQVADCRSNRNARFILQRDIFRICEYFIRQGAPCDPAAITERLWTRYAADVQVDLE